MENLKYKHIKIAKEVWELYQNGMDKSAISKELKINRAEVTHIIKYTTHTLFLKDNESENIIYSLSEEKEILLKKLHLWKYSDVDAYQNNMHIGKKLTNKRLVEIRESEINELQKTLSEKESKYLNSKKWYWLFFAIVLFSSFIAGVFIKGYIMKQQNYRQIDISPSWESQEGDTLYRLMKKN